MLDPTPQALQHGHHAGIHALYSLQTLLLMGGRAFSQ